MKDVNCQPSEHIRTLLRQKAVACKPKDVDHCGSEAPDWMKVNRLEYNKYYGFRFTLKGTTTANFTDTDSECGFINKENTLLVK